MGNLEAVNAFLDICKVQNDPTKHITRREAIEIMRDAFRVFSNQATDPQPVPQLCCQVDGCLKQATCGAPTKLEYKHVCGDHWKEVMGL